MYSQQFERIRSTMGRFTDTKRSAASLRLGEFLQEKVQRPFPEWLDRTTSFLDRMCCFSYAGSQAYGEDEAPEIAYRYEFDDEENNSILAKNTKEGPSSVCSEQTVCSEHTLLQDDSFGDLSEDELARMEGFVFLDASRGIVLKPDERRRCTADTSMRTLSTADSSESLSSEESEEDDGDMREIALPSVCSETFAPRGSSQVNHWSHGDMTEREYKDSMRIRQIQSESLVELPFLTMTKGYRC